jgi:hypothetical protein
MRRIGRPRDHNSVLIKFHACERICHASGGMHPEVKSIFAGTRRVLVEQHGNEDEPGEGHP